MESAAFEVKRVHVLRIDPGEDVLESIEAFIASGGPRQAVVLGGYGTLAASNLHWVAHGRIPPDNIFGRQEGGIEILSMSGLVADGRPHVHVTLSMPNGAFGGHLETGCVAYVLCEVFLAEVDGPAMRHVQADVSVEGMGAGKVPRLTFGP